MERTTASRTEVMKPLFLKAGIPLVLSVAGFLYARIIARRTIVAKPSSFEANESSQEFINSHEVFGDEEIKDDQEHMITSSNLLNSRESSDFHVKEEILSLKSSIEEHQKREWDLESHFIHYRVMKEQESVFKEFRNVFLLEAAHVEFLDREISSMEAEKQRFKNLVVDYLRVLEQHDFAKHENGLLQRKVKKLLRRRREQSRVIKEKNLKIEATEAEIFTCREVLETRTNLMEQLNDDVRELQTIVNQLQAEKNELLIRLNSSENSASSISKIEAEGIKMEDCTQLVNELEQLHNDRAAEIAELTYLRWTNACLRHELMKIQEQQQHSEENKDHLILELEGKGDILDHQNDGSVLGHGEEPCLDAAPGGNQACPKRKKLLHKLKKWVEGSDNMKSKSDEKEKHENKCFGRLSVSDDVDDGHLIHSRRSCSSA